MQAFYGLSWSQHKILIDFYTHLAEQHYDFRMVDGTERKSDTPRESLAHILYVELVYLNGVRTGRLEFISMGSEHYTSMTKAQLLAEMERIDQEIYNTLTAEAFDSNCTVEVPWGGRMNAINVLFFLRDHDILHIGWNLAVMDHLNVPRFESLIQYWGP